MCKAYEVLTSTKDLTRDEWLAFRRMGIGGSDAAAIVGLNPWSSAMTVFADKMGVLPEKEATEAMRLGTDLEAYVAERFCEATGKKVRRENNILRSVEHPFMFANVDRMIIGEKAGLECKTTSPWNGADWESGVVPATYYCQMSHYMAVTGYSKFYLAVLVFGKGFYHYEVERNEEDIEALIKAEEQFWECVQNKTAPDPDGSAASAAVLQQLYKGDKGGEVELQGVGEDLQRYAEIEQMMKHLEAEKSAITQRVQAQMGDAHVGHADGWLATWRPVKSKRLDTKRIKAEAPDLYERYAKESISRRFALKQTKEAM